MPPTHALRSAQRVTASLPNRTNALSTIRRPLSSTSTLKSGDSHGDHYDPPSGWLFGVPPGQKYEKEGWEGLWVWGFWGSIGLAAVAYAYKPDTSIQTWALEEARRRLEKEGILPDPDTENKSILNREPRAE